MRDLACQKLHSFSVNNAALCRSSSQCGCFYCLRTFSPKTITDYWDSGQTATCPFCHLDTVLPGYDGIVITKKLLKDMQHYAWDGRINNIDPIEPATYIEID